ncbi:MAG: hotdog domain-containing protein [Gammaproteobacteria bacterium]|nr:hotdog domain-containing protein [Gammaproteobacteria bacterium]
MYFEDHPEDKEAVIRTMAMPKDTNGLGDIFGGWLMSHADIAGAVLGFRRARGRVVTIAVNEFTFLRPVFVGDVVSFYTDLNKVGNTSITVDITMFAARTTDGREESVRVATAQITYVHVGADRMPRKVPKS